jgi:uncharacterized protein YxeA
VNYIFILIVIIIIIIITSIYFWRSRDFVVEVNKLSTDDRFWENLRWADDDFGSTRHDRKEMLEDYYKLQFDFMRPLKLRITD